MRPREPHVTIVTPVFNGEKYLRQCIDSVVKQTYENWSYIIVNNCSVDRTLAISLEAANADPRIKVITNDAFVGAIENHNIAFRQLSPDSAYCKLVSADDWLFPEHLSQLVALGEAHPSAAVISSHVINCNGPSNPGLPIESSLFDGKLLARRFFLEDLNVFWLPTSVLYRASFVRAKVNFYPGSAPSADLEACLECLRTGDLAFCHQILAYERIHPESITDSTVNTGSYFLDRIRVLHTFGPEYVSADEYNRVQRRMLWTYYRDVLGRGFVSLKGIEFWRFHAREMRSLGYSLLNLRLLLGVALSIAEVALNLIQTLVRLLKYARAVTSRGSHEAE